MLRFLLFVFASDIRNYTMQECYKYKYPRPAVTTDCVIFHSDSRDFDCTERVSFLFETLSKIGTEFAYGQQIVILRDDESEYNAEDVLRHLKQ